MIFKATIIVMTFNHQEYILRLLQSIINFFDNELFEVIVSDDASTDKTIDIVENYSNKYSNVKIIQHKVNIGIMGNLISALSRASGSSIFLISGDDLIISEGYLLERINIMDSNKEISAVFMRSLLTDEGFKNIIVPKENLTNKKFTIRDFYRGLNLPTNGMLFRNYFLTESNLEELKKQSNTVKFNDDLFMTAYLLTKGHIVQSSYLGYIQRIFNKKKSGNYNSIKSTLDKLENEFNTLESISIVTGNNLKIRFLVLFFKEIYNVFQTRNFKDVLIIIKKYYSKIPLSPYAIILSVYSLKYDYDIRRYFK